MADESGIKMQVAAVTLSSNGVIVRSKDPSLIDCLEEIAVRRGMDAARNVPGEDGVHGLAITFLDGMRQSAGEEEDEFVGMCEICPRLDCPDHPQYGKATIDCAQCDRVECESSPYHGEWLEDGGDVS